MVILDSATLNSSQTNSELLSIKTNEQHLNEDERVRKETTTQSSRDSFFKTFLKENFDTFDTTSTKALRN